MLNAATLLLLLLTSSLLTTPTAPAITATDADTGEEVLCRPLPDSGRFALAFDHSMYGGEVREDYAVAADGRLRRIAVTTANEAAAEYYAYTVDVVRAGDRFRVDVPAAEFAEVVVRVDRVGAHRLVLGRERVDLLALAGDGRALRLAGRSIGAVDRLLGRSC